MTEATSIRPEQPKAALDQVAAQFGGVEYMRDVGKPLVFHMHPILNLWEDQLDVMRELGSIQGLAVTAEVGWISDLGFNAFASRVGDVDVIGINIGVYFRLLPVFEAMFSHPQTFPNVGDADDRGRPIVLGYDACVHGDSPIPEGGFHHTRLEAQLLFRLLEIATTFVFAHELCHIRNGHVDWTSAYGGLQIIDERRMAGQLAIGSLELQTLEWDADSYAVQRVLHMWGNSTPVQRGGRKLSSFPAQTGLGNRDQALSIITFAVYTVLKFFEPLEPPSSLSEILALTHPPAYLRAHQIISTIIHALHVSGGIDHQEAVAIIATAVVDAEKAWCRVFRRPVVNVYAHEHLAIAAEYNRAMNDCWEVLHPQLLPLSRYGDLPAAKNPD